VLAADDYGIIYEGAFGRRAVDKPEPMTLNSVFRIASMTKPSQVRAAMQLVEKGQIGLEQPMGDLLPGDQGCGDTGRVRWRRHATIAWSQNPDHAAAHISGYGYDIFNPDLARYVQIAGLRGILNRKNDALRAPLLFDPGSGWEYGIGLDLVGKVIEEVTGEDLESYFRRYILDPLGMRDTGFLLCNE
jgi:methyl acetate hydrolase